MIHVEQHGPVLCIRLARSLMGRPLQWAAAYWVEGLLIDAGPSCAAPQLLRMLEHVYVDQIAVTHCHEERIGGLALLRERFPNAPIYAPRRALAAIEEPERLRLPVYRRVMWGRPRAAAGVRSYDEAGNVVCTPSYTLRVVETPGHSADHAGLFEPEQRWLFSGDAFIGGEEQAWPREADLFGVLSSLRTLASLRPERLYPGRGAVRRSPLPAIQAKIARLSELAQNVAALEAKGVTATEMAAILLPSAPLATAMQFWTGGQFSSLNLIEACRSYNALMRPDTNSPRRKSPPAPPDMGEEGWADPPARWPTDRDDVLR
ncbi:MAG: MBL fold metallo-hydrolase [Chloroflexota bacterium]|jgi:glyoxylase-like metal-dependent hydrolase (beta-lactamase superfamily II)|nr:MBL fold metallo-hydrolase [Chloroflexota bacterium]